MIIKAVLNLILHIRDVMRCLLIAIMVELWVTWVDHLVVGSSNRTGSG